MLDDPGNRAEARFPGPIRVESASKDPLGTNLSWPGLRNHSQVLPVVRRPPLRTQRRGRKDNAQFLSQSS